MDAILGTHERQLVYQHFMTRQLGDEVEYWGAYVQIAWFGWDDQRRWPFAEQVLLFSGTYPDKFKSQISVARSRLNDYVRRRRAQGFESIDRDGDTARIIRRDWDCLTMMVEQRWPQVHEQVQRKMVWLTLQGKLG